MKCILNSAEPVAVNTETSSCRRSGDGPSTDVVEFKGKQEQKTENTVA